MIYSINWTSDNTCAINGSLDIEVYTDTSVLSTSPVRASPPSGLQSNLWSNYPVSHQLSIAAEPTSVAYRKS